ncbi:thioredoxin family protein [Propionicicella superfundia]|uniref:thioredoxin family protein n=1 Tax=Propionicicella superfundia TaxID=348582 RepID=UPI000412023E|nr:thioredoxin family protein [Propionicicella superfundia]
MTGLWIVLAAVGVAVAFGGYRYVTDGRAKRERPSRQRQLRADQLGADLGTGATLVQFSAPVCGPCRTTHRLLETLTADDPTVIHVDIDAETRLDLVSEFGITRTPTVLLLDRDGTVRHRIVGPARRPDVLDALGQVTGSAAA